MNKSSVLLLSLSAFAANAALGATGSLIVYDDADRNGFDHGSAACGAGNAFFGETTIVHGGVNAVAISEAQDGSGAGWTAPGTYSTSSDYDGVSLWVNAGNSQTTTTSLGVYDENGNGQFLHLEDVYGAKLPVNTWIHLQVSFSSPWFASNGNSPPATLKTICVITHSSGSYLYLDDVSLIGADIFKNGFEN